MKTQSSLTLMKALGIIFFLALAKYTGVLNQFIVVIQNVKLP